MKSLKDHDFALDKKKQQVIITWKPNLPMASGLTSPAASVERRKGEEERRRGGGDEVGDHGVTHGYGKLQLSLASHDRFQKVMSRGSQGGAERCCQGIVTG
jgi:hypothetical protein